MGDTKTCRTLEKLTEEEYHEDEKEGGSQRKIGSKDVNSIKISRSGVQ
jgi:hypothetical protein